MPKRKRRQRKGKGSTPVDTLTPGTVTRTTGTGETITFNNDTSFIPEAETGDVYINRQLWEGWLREFDNHVVFGEGPGAIHRFYDNAPDRTSDEMAQPGVIAPFGEPSVEIRGNVLIDTDLDSSTIIEAGDGTDVQLTNIVLNSTSATSTDITGVRCVTSIGTASGWGPPSTRWALLQDFITRNPDQAPSTRDTITRWLGWNQFGCCRESTRHYIYDDCGHSTVQRGEDPLWRQRRIQRQNRRNTAELRAEQLLWNVLDRTQRREWRAHGYFHIQIGPRLYRIEVRKRIANVNLVDRDGDVVKTYCCHTADHLPNADNALAQMMMLLHDEAGFLKMANIHFDRDRQLGTSRVTIDNDGSIYYSRERAA